jgi:peptidoglycan/xylan/chitin deacetylase (PgdA/CDA1 family)
VKFGADRAKTVQVVDRIISRYKAEGYEFVTVPEMMATMGAST